MRIERDARQLPLHYAQHTPSFEEEACQRLDLERAADSLSPELQELLELIQADRTEKEIVETMHVTRGAVLSRWQRLVRELRKNLGLS